MQFHVSIRRLMCRSRGRIGLCAQSGFLIVEAMIALAATVLFSLAIVSLRVQLINWHTQAYDYLQATTIADRTFERIILKQEFPQNAGKFRIKTTTKKDEKVPYKHIQVTVNWTTISNQKKEINLFGGMIDEA